MRNIKLTIEYDGTNYSGWQIQNSRKPPRKASQRGRQVISHNLKTIQDTIEKALQKILREKIRVIGSGRTDAGVHALGQVANFKTKSTLACRNIQQGLNSILPYDIRIKQVVDVPADFHARFSARSKFYRYCIVNHSFVSPFLQRYCYLVKYPLNLQKMRKAGQYLSGRHNFKSFQAVDRRERDAMRTIKRLHIRRNKGLIHIDIEANGFLYRMVRNIVGTLIEVGRGKLKPESIKKILKAKNRIYAGPTAPAKGLTLVQVNYSSPVSS